MSGSDQSARLQGLLSGIAGTVGELGVGGDWTSNAIRTVNRPDFMAGSDKVLGKYGRPAFDMNNVNNLDAMANWASRNGYEDQAKQYMALSYQQKEKETALNDQARLQEGQSGVADMSRKMMTILKDPTLTPEGRETQLNNLQASANAIARVTPNMEPLKVANLRTNVEQAFLSQASVQQQMDLATQQNERDWERLGNEELRLDMAGETLAMASEKHGEWVNTADYRETLRAIEQDKGNFENSLMLAKRFAGTEGGKEKFNAATGGLYEGVFDSVQQQRTAQQLQIDEASQRLESGSFDYKTSDLVSLGIPEELAANIIKIGKNVPNAGNTMVITALKSVLGGAEAPTSAMIGLFEGAALNAVIGDGYDHPGKDSDEKDEAKAKEIALAMAGVFMKTNSTEEALKVIPLMLAKQGGGGSSEEELEQLMRQAQEILAQTSDATDPDG
jgi:hypothetical protein